LGSGGGAGGSVQVVTRSILGNGIVNLRGGDGSSGGGGGGSGGRLVTNLLQNFNASSMMDTRNLKWQGTIDLNGGKGGQIL